MLKLLGDERLLQTKRNSSCVVHNYKQSSGLSYTFIGSLKITNEPSNFAELFIRQIYRIWGQEEQIFKKIGMDVGVHNYWIDSCHVIWIAYKYKENVFAPMSSMYRLIFTNGWGFIRWNRYCNNQYCIITILRQDFFHKDPVGAQIC